MIHPPIPLHLYQYLLQENPRSAFRRLLTRAALLVAATAALVPLAGCAAGNLDNMWHDTAYDATDMKNVLVIAVRPDPVRRRLWEDAFAQSLSARGSKATTSYSIWVNAVPDTAQVIEAVRAQGFDGVVVSMRLPDGVEKTFTPGYVRREPETRQSPWTGAYYTAWRTVEVPDREGTQSVANFQTDVWSTLDGGKLVWSGSDRTTNGVDANFIKARVENMWVPEIAKSGIFPAK